MSSTILSALTLSTIAANAIVTAQSGTCNPGGRYYCSWKNTNGKLSASTTSTAIFNVNTDAPVEYEASATFFSTPLGGSTTDGQQKTITGRYQSNNSTAEVSNVVDYTTLGYYKVGYEVTYGEGSPEECQNESRGNVKWFLFNETGCAFYDELPSDAPVSSTSTTAATATTENIMDGGASTTTSTMAIFVEGGSTTTTAAATTTTSVDDTTSTTVSEIVDNSNESTSSTTAAVTSSSSATVSSSTAASTTTSPAASTSSAAATYTNPAGNEYFCGDMFSSVESNCLQSQPCPGDVKCNGMAGCFRVAQCTSEYAEAGMEQGKGKPGKGNEPMRYLRLKENV